MRSSRPSFKVANRKQVSWYSASAIGTLRTLEKRGEALGASCFAFDVSFVVSFGFTAVFTAVFGEVFGAVFGAIAGVEEEEEPTSENVGSGKSVSVFNVFGG